MHGVTVAPAARGQDPPQPHWQDKSTTTTIRDGRGQQPKEPICNACEHPPAKQHERQPPKQQ
eukprot:460603-Prymnesium_polylepis.1